MELADEKSTPNLAFTCRFSERISLPYVYQVRHFFMFPSTPATAIKTCSLILDCNLYLENPIACRNRMATAITHARIRFLDQANYLCNCPGILRHLQKLRICGPWHMDRLNVDILQDGTSCYRHFEPLLESIEPGKFIHLL
ncbi:unnamed protein product [Somion occarium]|uniref:Uncharacterized protein n=1 Tax=Somion occarium TaxID=3059160 RepID=A0ABP1EAM4_9APHY